MKVMNNVLRSPLVLLLASTALVGCVAQQPLPLYRLDNGVAEMPEQEGGVAVLLGPVSVADYLQRDALLQRLPDGSIAADPQQARWAGSLKEDVDQLLMRQLATQLKTQKIESAPASEGFVADVQIELAITRLDSGPQHPAVLEAQWRLLDEHGKRQGSRLVRLQEAHQGSITDQVQAQSRLLQRLSVMLAEAIEPVLVARNAAKTTVKAPKRSEPEVPRLKALEPLRTDMEVFRF